MPKVPNWASFTDDDQQAEAAIAHLATHGALWVDWTITPAQALLHRLRSRTTHHLHLEGAGSHVDHVIIDVTLKPDWDLESLGNVARKRDSLSAQGAEFASLPQW